MRKKFAETAITCIDSKCLVYLIGNTNVFLDLFTYGLENRLYGRPVYEQQEFRLAVYI